MNWMNSLAALVAACVLMSPGAASAYYWFGFPTYSNYSKPSVAAPKLASTTNSTSATSAAPAPTGTSAVEQELVRLTNQERIKSGLAPLSVDATLTSLARLKSADMVAKNYFSHTSPTYGSPARMLASKGVSYSFYAENIAKGTDAARIHAMWMNSAGHRANIMNARLNRVGIGVAPNGSGYAATQLFIAR